MLNNQTSRLNIESITKPAADSQEFLVRSKPEVLRLLNNMMEQDKPISITFLNAGRVTASSMIYVDEASQMLLLACPPEWHTLMGAGGDSIMLSCVFEDCKVEFQGGSAVIVDLDGTPVVGLPIPEFLWRFQRRRDARQKVAGLNIVLNMGFLEADAEVVDLSKSGVGLFNSHREVKLDIGEILHNCTITLPGVGQIAVSLVVQNQIEVQLADGRQMMRVGCKLTGLKESSRQLIAHFLESLAQA